VTSADVHVIDTPRESGQGPEARRLDVAIVGGGISGLVAAYRLSQKQESRGPLSLRLFEAQNRLGGLIHTERVEAEQQGYCLFETGPDSMVTGKAAAIDLCRELGLADALVPPRSAGSFSVVHDRRLHPLPSGFRLVAPTEPWPLLRSGLFSWRGKARMLLESRVEPAPSTINQRSEDTAADESVESFVRRRFGKEAFERVAEPVLGGLFIADVTKLSAQRALGPFVELERQHGSVLRGLRSSSRSSRSVGHDSPSQLTLLNGLGSLVERLVDEIPTPWLELDCGVKQIRRLPSGAWQIETARGTWLANTVVLACPAPRCKELLKAAAPTLATSLAELRFASCVTVNLVYRRSDVAQLPGDFGFFVPRHEPNDIVAATYASEKFPGVAPDGFHVVRTFQGGPLDPSAVDLDDETLVQRSHGDLAPLIGVNGKPVASRVNRFRNTMPQFDIGHRARVDLLQREIEQHGGLHLAGSALGAYGLADCAASGEAVAASIQTRRRDA
jgi:oxygen-dependent protoporphyrinogen oxidase